MKALDVIKKPFDYLKEGFSSLTESFSEGWEYLKENTRTALTKFNISDDDDWHDMDFPAVSWGFMANDVYCTDNEIIVRLEVPGMDKKDLDIFVHNNYLVVNGEKKIQSEQRRASYYLSQCAFGRFQRVIPLPYDVSGEDVKAKYKNGVLMVRVPYKVRRKQIKIM